MTAKLRFHALPVALLVMLFSSVAGPLFADVPSSKRYRTTISYTPSKYGQIIVQVKLSATVTGNFILDTGTNSTCVTDALAAKMGLPSVPAVDIKGMPVLMSGKRAQMVTVPLLQMSNFRLLNMQCLVLNQKLLTPIFGQPVDGILGAGVLVIYPMYFDFPRHQITLFSPSPLTTDELRGVGMDDAAVLPINDLDDRLVFTTPVVMVNGEGRAKENLLVDTGGTVTMISEQTARQLQLQPISDNRNSPTFFGNITARQAYLPVLSIGYLSVNNLPVLYTPNISEAFETHIGLDVLSRFHVLLDYKQKAMYLKPIIVTALPPFGKDQARTP